ncbi:MAG: diguanylate cyclase [Burkholderiales bacterium]|nr:diguanylate cyclase [Burkholderiales bacterium]
MTAYIPFRPLTRRLVRSTVVVGVICMALAAVVRSALDYRDARSAYRDEANEIVQTHVPLLSLALWDIEPGAVQEQLDRIAARPQIAWVQLSTRTGQHFHAGRLPANGQGDETLSIPRPRSQELLGTLTLGYDRKTLLQRTANELFQTLLSLLVLTLMVCVLLIVMLRRELQGPLARITQFCAQLTPGHLTERLDLGRSDRPWRDEIDLVGEGFETLHDGIERYVAERDEAMAALAQHRDQLDRAVVERTADLTRLNLFLETLSLLSTRFIHLPPDDYPDGLRHALSTLAQYFGATACALAECDAQGVYRWRFAYRRNSTSHCHLQENVALAALPAMERNGWLIQRWDTEPEDRQLALFAREYGATALALCRHETANSAQLLACMVDAPHNWTNSGERQLKMVADMLFSTLGRWHDLKALDLTRRELWRMSRSDPLTGLANRRRFDELKLDETRRALRTSFPLTLMMIDVDWFKRYNDGYGHAAGDECLVAVANVLESAVHRTGELVARLGGEEFVVLLPAVDNVEATAMGERLRVSINALALPHEYSPIGRVTVSIGIAVLTADYGGGLPVEELFAKLMRRADEALYLSKANGRDRIELLPLMLSEDAGATPTSRRGPHSRQS